MWWPGIGAPLAQGTDTAAADPHPAGRCGRQRGLLGGALGLPGRTAAGAGRRRTRRPGTTRGCAAAGVRPLLVPDAEAPTATVIALVDATAERTFLTDSGAVLRLSPADWSPSLLDGVGHLHLSGYLLFADTSRQLALLALESARALGIPVSVDPASAGFIAELGVGPVAGGARGRGRPVPERRRGPPADRPAGPGRRRREAEPPCPADRRDPGCRRRPGRGVGHGHGPRPAVPAEAVDSTGAGDAFTGAFLAARLAGADAATAAAEGCRAGAEAVTLTGGRPDQRRPPHAG